MKKVICLLLSLLSLLPISAQVDMTQTEGKESKYLFKFEEVVPSNIPKSVSMYTAITFQATFQIDIREEKYRIKVYDAFADTEPDHLNHMRGATRKSLKMVEDDLKTTKEICKKLNYSEKWALDNHFISVMESEKELNHAMSMVRYDYTDCCKALLDSLKKAMNVEDDF